MAVVVLLAAGVFLVARGGGGGGGSNSPTPQPPGLPNAYLRTADGQFVRAVPGTNCWNKQCVDMAGPMTNVEPVPLPPGAAVAVTFEQGAPTEWSLTWVPAPAEAPAPEGGVRAWVALEVPADALTGTQAPARPGRYLALIFARWDGFGDISYGLYVEVK